MSADYEPPILYARDSKGRFLFIDGVPNGDACGCSCPACGQPMRARNAGLIRKHSFAHQPGMTCTWAVEAVITMLAKQAIEEAGCMALPALYYNNAVTGSVKRISESKIMKVTQVETLDISGRQAPCLVITVQGGGKTARFGLCVTLRRKLTHEQEDSLLEGTRGIVLVDLGIDLARKKSEQGKHYDRDELIKSYQNKEFLAGVLLDKSSDLMSWERSVTQSEREIQSAAEKVEIDRKREEERAKAQKAREESLRRAEETRKRAEEARRCEAEERAAKAARDGIVREPDRFVTEYEEYDVRLWGDKRLPPGDKLASYERYVVNGALQALIIDGDNGSSVRVRCDMSLDSINEVSWKLEELSNGFDKFTLVLDASELQKQGQAAMVNRIDGIDELVLLSDTYEYCCALQGLVARDIDIYIFANGGRGRTISLVDVNSGKVYLKQFRMPLSFELHTSSSHGT